MLACLAGVRGRRDGIMGFHGIYIYIKCTDVMWISDDNFFYNAAGVGRFILSNHQGRGLPLIIHIR